MQSREERFNVKTPKKGWWIEWKNKTKHKKKNTEKKVYEANELSQTRWLIDDEVRME